ncbi:MAG: hypothetical protein U0894_16250, partial [Pirellulales bacterium]
PGSLAPLASGADRYGDSDRQDALYTLRRPTRLPASLIRSLGYFSRGFCEKPLPQHYPKD